MGPKLARRVQEALSDDRQLIVIVVVCAVMFHFLWSLT